MALEGILVLTVEKWSRWSRLGLCDRGRGESEGDQAKGQPDSVRPSEGSWRQALSTGWGP